MYKLYFLKTRYYDPELCRFISIDDLSYLDPESINGLNLYAYCGNNPVMAVDPEGTKLKWWKKVLIGVGAAVLVAALVIATVVTGGAAAVAAGVITGAVVGGFYGGITAAVKGENVGWGIVIGAVAGAFMGAVAGLGGALIEGGKILGGLALSFAGGFAGGALADVATQFANDGKITDRRSPVISGIQWGVLNMLSGLSGSVAEGFLENLAVGIGVGPVISGLGMIIDLIRLFIKKQKGTNLPANTNANIRSIYAQ